MADLEERAICARRISLGASRRTSGTALRRRVVGVQAVETDGLDEIRDAWAACRFPS
jgi:hypothetical protein